MSPENTKIEGKQPDPLAFILGRANNKHLDKKPDQPEFIRQFGSISNKLSKAESRFVDSFKNHEEVLDVYKDLIESNMDIEAKNDQVMEQNRLLNEEIQ